MDIYEIKQRAEALSAQTDLMSILPTDVGDLINDLATVVNENNINGAKLGIKQTYESVAAMNEATSPVDYDGNPLKKGNLVNIYNQNNSEENNRIYSFRQPGWAFVTVLRDNYNSDILYPIKGDITSFIDGSSEDAINRVYEILGQDLWTLVQLDKEYIIDINGITANYSAGSVGSGNYQINIRYNINTPVNVEIFILQNQGTGGPPTLEVKRVTINKVDDSPIYQLPGDITAGFSGSNYDEVLGTYPEFKAAFDAGKIFVSKGTYLKVNRVEGYEDLYTITFSFFKDVSLLYTYMSLLADGSQWSDNPDDDTYSIKGTFV